MQILLLTAYFPPEVGSASHLYYDLGVALRELGHQVTVLTCLPAYHAQGDLSRYRRRLWLREQVDGMEVIRVATPRLPRRLMAGRAIWQFGAALAMLGAGALAPRHDAAIVYSPPLPLGLAAWAVRAMRGTPFVLNVQDIFPQSAIDLGMLTNPTLISAFEAMERALYSKADIVTVHSESNASHVVARGGDPERVVVMPNWVDTDAIHPGGSGAAFSQKHGLGDAFVVSFGGVLALSQDLDVVLEAAALLREQGRIQWVIAGDGVERGRLIGRAADLVLSNVRFLPMLPREEYPQLLYASDVCLATLRAEVKTPVVPSKIANIMAAGRPVVAAMNLEGDAPRLIRDADCGCALPPGDARALADAVLGLYNDPALGRRLGASGRAYAEKHLSLRAAARRYSALLNELSVVSNQFSVKSKSSSTDN